MGRFHVEARPNYLSIFVNVCSLKSAKQFQIRQLQNTTGNIHGR
jgi:hypothetical protein